jgi:hypothetical protein
LVFLGQVPFGTHGTHYGIHHKHPPAPSSRELILYPIYSIGIDLNVHVQVFQNAI